MNKDRLDLEIKLSEFALIVRATGWRGEGLAIVCDRILVNKHRIVLCGVTRDAVSEMEDALHSLIKVDEATGELVSDSHIVEDLIYDLAARCGDFD